MKFEVGIKVELKDKNGKVIKTILCKPKSYVRQMMDLLSIQMYGSARSVKDTGGSAQSVDPSNLTFNATVVAGTSNRGIQVGTGTDAVEIDDYALQTPIAHGVGAGQLQYGACGVGVVAIVGTSAQFTISRTFTNVSGDAIDVQEVGLVSFGSGFLFLLEHSLLSFEISDGLSATVTYTIKVTV